MKDVFINKLTISKFSNVIKLDEIAQNDFNLSVSRYVDTFEEDFIRLDDLTVEKREIDENIENLNLKIEKMMKELDIRF
jgi:type I restriction enzyme M protein